jgi:hypothetical protein
MKEVYGGAVFFRSNSWLSRIIRMAAFFQKKYKPDKWSHVGLIHEKNGQLHLIEALIDKGVVSRPLFDVLAENRKNGNVFKIKKLSDKAKNFLKQECYEQACAEVEGKNYIAIGALAAGLDFPVDIKVSKAMHCSYLATKLLQTAGVVNLMYNAKEMTPQDVCDFKIWSE